MDYVGQCDVLISSLLVRSEDDGLRNRELMEAIGARMKAKPRVLVTHPMKRNL